MIVEEATYLEHYGTKGMKWGVRKNPEKREAKAAKFDAKAAKTGARIDKVDRRLETARTRYYRNELLTQKRDLTRKQLHELKNAEAVRAGKLTTNEKAAVAATTALGVAGVALLLKHQGDVKVNKVRNEHSDFVNARMKLDEKMKTRIKDLNSYSSKTKEGGESAARETEIAKEFYQNQVSKMMKKHNIDETIVKKMKLKPPF